MMTYMTKHDGEDNGAPKTELEPAKTDAKNVPTFLDAMLEVPNPRMLTGDLLFILIVNFLLQIADEVGDPGTRSSVCVGELTCSVVDVHLLSLWFCLLLSILVGWGVRPTHNCANDLIGGDCERLENEHILGARGAVEPQLLLLGGVR